MRALRFLLVAGVVAVHAGTTPAEAQFPKRLTERIKTATAEKKRQTEENAVNRAAEPADSALARAAAPVDSLTARAGGTAGAAVGRLGRGKDSSSEEEARIRSALASGRADLAGVTFEPGSASIAATSEPSLRALMRIMTDSPGVFLIQVRADPGDVAGSPQLANSRASGIKGWLVSNGIPGERVFATAEAPATGAAWVTVTVMQ